MPALTWKVRIDAAVPHSAVAAAVSVGGDLSVEPLDVGACSVPALMQVRLVLIEDARPVPCRNSFAASELVFLRSLARSQVFADQAADGLPRSVLRASEHPAQVPGRPIRRRCCPTLCVGSVSLSKGSCAVAEVEFERATGLQPWVNRAAVRPFEVPGQFLAGRAGAKKSVSSWLTRSCSS